MIAALGLHPHPEGGHYRETWRDRPEQGGRGAGTAIHFLLAAGQASHWHKVDASELWLWQAGAPLQLRLHDSSGPTQVLRLGPHHAAGESLHALVPPLAWQAAASLGAWSLVACVVAPAFDFAGFTLAPPGWAPHGAAGV